MAYCTQADLLKLVSRNELIQLTDLDDEGTINTDTVTEVISEADEFVNGYLARRRTVPVDPVPTMLRHLSGRLTLYFLHLHRRSVTDDLKDQFGTDNDFLEAYAAGDGSLGDDDEATTPGVGSSKQDANDRLFTRDDMEGWG